MENILPAFVTVMLLLSATLVPVQRYLAAQDRLQLARQAVEVQLLERARTDLAAISTSVSADGLLVDAALENAGQTRLADFDRWDVIVQYYDASGVYHVESLTYYSGAVPDNQEWIVAGLYLSAGSSAAEAFEPGIFNPDEKLVLRFRLSPEIGAGATNLVTVSTPNGLRLSTYFTRPCTPELCGP